MGGLQEKIVEELKASGHLIIIPVTGKKEK